MPENNHLLYIAFFIPNMTGGGAERVTLNLANGIAEYPFAKVDLVLTEKTGPLLSDISNKVNLVDLGASRIATSVAPLAKYLRSNKPQILISSLNTANIIAIIAKGLVANCKTRLIVTEHNTLSVTAKNPNSLRSRLVPWLVSKFYPRADGIVAVSKGVANDLAEFAGLPINSIEVIYNPVITPFVRTQAIKPCDDQWINDSDTPVLLGIGRLSPQKDFANLIQAVAIVLKKRKVKLLILGEGEMREQLESLIRQYDLADHIRMPGFVSNPYSYLAQAQVFVLSSRWEGLPTVLIEALYCGCKPVSTDCPSGPDEILKQGRYGVLVPQENPEELAKGIITALESTKNEKQNDESWHPFTLERSIEHYLSYTLDKEQYSNFIEIKNNG